MISVQEFLVSFLTESKAEFIKAYRAAPPRRAALPAARSPQHDSHIISLISFRTRVLSSAHYTVTDA